MKAKRGTDNQPINTIKWVDRLDLRANTWNPNRQAPPEHKLLKTSILESGWTQPIVACPDGEIIDGYHRWTISRDPEVYALTGGLVPVVYVTDADEASLRMSTIRHNRARGTHGVLPMAEIVRSLSEVYGLSDEEIQTRLMMEDEEVDRLKDRASIVERVGEASFNNGWVPK